MSGLEFTEQLVLSSRVTVMLMLRPSNVVWAASVVIFPTPELDDWVTLPNLGREVETLFAEVNVAVGLSDTTSLGVDINCVPPPTAATGG